MMMNAPHVEPFTVAAVRVDCELPNPSAALVSRLERAARLVGVAQALALLVLLASIAALTVFRWKTALSLNHADARRSLAEAEKRQLYAGLEQSVEQRTAQLRAANRELEALNMELKAFSYSVSHDLRSPPPPRVPPWNETG